MKILISDAVDRAAVELLKKEHDVVEAEPSMDELKGMIGEYDAILLRSRTKLTADIIEAGKNLKVIGRAGIGVDNIDLRAATEHGIIVVNAPGSNSISVVELTIGHMISIARKLVEADKHVRSGQWNRKAFKGTELMGKTLGLIGFGRIGSEVARRAQVFGMDVIIYDPYVNRKVAEEMGVKIVETKEDVLRNSDFISIHALLTDETRGMISGPEFEIMKNSAYIVNCARGGIVDEKALYTALKEGKIKGAALDVYENEPPADSPLLQLDNIVFTPHLGASTREAQLRAGTVAAEQMLIALRGERPKFLVNRDVWKE